MGHPVLRKQAKALEPTEIRTPPFQKLIDDMIETMHEYAGIGLAGAPGARERPAVRRRASSRRDGSLKVLPFVNPEITPVGTALAEDWEGCLSIPDIRGTVVPRPREVVVRALDRRGKPFEMALRGLPGARRAARDGSPRRRAVLRPDEVVRDADLPRGVLPLLARTRRRGRLIPRRVPHARDAMTLVDRRAAR